MKSLFLKPFKEMMIEGSNAVVQYHEPLRSIFSNPQTCPEIYLLWFHHLQWDHKKTRYYT